MATYALSDIHGFKSVYDQVKEILKPEDKVIFLGDAADRGPHGWQCITAILDDPQFDYILGNHDLFLVRSFFGPDGWRNERMWDKNGGDATRMSMEGVPREVRDEYLHRLEKCPCWMRYDAECGASFFLSHSGRYATNPISADYMEDFTWDRAHFVNPAPKEVDFIVHGHTPIRYLISILNDNSKFFEGEKDLDSDSEFVPGLPFYYADRSKIDIDNGTVKTGFATLLNLDTFEATPIEVKGQERARLWR